jgi:hypothetical protein
VRWQAVFRATPLFRSQEKRCRARLATLLVTALQKILAFTCFVFFVAFVFPTPEVTVAYLKSFHDQVHESQMRPMYPGEEFRLRPVRKNAMMTHSYT